MSTWHRDGLLSSADAETTGVDIETDRIVTWSRWIIRPAQGYKRCAEWLINPGVPIPDAATNLHGITTEHARAHGVPAAGAIREIATDLVYWSADEGAVSVLFNAAFDLSLLHRECLRHGHTALAEHLAQLSPVVDPFVLDKETVKKRRGKGMRKLGAVAQLYGIPLGDDAHGSRADALATARLAYVLAEKHSRIGDTAPADLHTQQIGWRAEQAASLQEYKRRSDPDAVVDPSWPLTPVPVQPVQEALA